MISFNVSPVSRLSAALVSLAFVSALAACSDDGSGGTGGAGGSPSSSSSSGSTSSSTTGTGGTGGSASNPYDTADKINTYLDGKTLTMSGADIPTDPNGYNENVNFGQASQCYASVVMTPTAAMWHVDSTLGTLNDAPNTGDKGTCDHGTPGQKLSFDSTAILIENVTADCFDFTATYVGFSQEGRGQIAADGKTLKLELFFGGQATGHRCGDGAVGAKTVKIKGADFTGNAVQVYKVQ
ncbi:putative lipoprotein [Minicystis rosea]|nr:putative lipoprotein [Minicystis rosea]